MKSERDTELFTSEGNLTQKMERNSNNSNTFVEEIKAKVCCNCIFLNKETYNIYLC